MGPSGLRGAIIVAALGLCVPLAACAAADQTGSLVHRVKVWESGIGFAPSMRAVEADAARIAAARKGGARPAVVEFDCITLGQDVNKDYSSDLPSPDAALTTDLNAAFAAYFSYAQDCVDHKGSPATMKSIGHFLRAGNQALAAAQDRSKAILG